MRTKLFTTLAIAAVFALSAFTTVEKTDVYKVNTDKSTVAWLGKKVTGKHDGNIKLKEASLEVKSGKLTGGKFVMDMASITNNDITDDEMRGKLVGHLKSDDFFGVEKHPTATFVIKSAEKKKGDEYLIKGDMTIKGKTQAIEFPAQVKVSGSTVTAEAKVVLDRSKYDVKYGSGSFFDNLGDNMIYDDFELTIKVEASK